MGLCRIRWGVGKPYMSRGWTIDHVGEVYTRRCGGAATCNAINSLRGWHTTCRYVGQPQCRGDEGAGRMAKVKPAVIMAVLAMLAKAKAQAKEIG